ncbi:MAG TPA: hypothetical protein VHF07_06765 [Nitrospiraceae bacterium]|nr:hypothetical protein [Nitrospiraceae bacterium]
MLAVYRSAFLLFAILIGLAPVSATAEALPSEPGEEHLVNEDVNIINGLYTREYSLRGDGIIDYRTARQIINSQYNDYGDTVVDAMPHPLFYWYDEEKSGRFSMWIDPKGEGCQCDIVPYIALAGDLEQ